MKRILLIILLILFSLISYSQRHLPECRYRIDYTHHIVDWDRANRVPRFVYYIIYQDSLKTLPRRSFRSDPDIITSSSSSDYTRSGYDRGHMLPHASAWNIDMRDECFIMTNIAPQTPSLNRGLWKSIEYMERKLSDPYAYVITGTHIYGEVRLLNKRVRVPKAFWKIIYNPVKDILVVYYAGQYDRGQAEDYEVTLESLEDIIDIDFDFNN